MLKTLLRYLIRKILKFLSQNVVFLLGKIYDQQKSYLLILQYLFAHSVQ